MPLVDVDTIRAAHPIENVVAASGVELRPTGRGFMCLCPFHVEDRQQCRAVGGVPGRFHCFACGARGDVIDYVARFNGLGFREAAEWLNGGAPFRGIAPLPVRLPQRRPVEGPDLNRTSRDRILAINEAAWEFFTTGPRPTAAERYLTDQRHIDVAAIRSIDNRSVVGWRLHRSPNSATIFKRWDSRRTKSSTPI